jgi:hypothetical protein
MLSWKWWFTSWHPLLTLFLSFCIGSIGVLTIAAVEILVEWWRLNYEALMPIIYAVLLGICVAHLIGTVPTLLLTGAVLLIFSYSLRRQKRQQNGWSRFQGKEFDYICKRCAHHGMQIRRAGITQSFRCPACGNEAPDLGLLFTLRYHGGL